MIYQNFQKYLSLIDTIKDLNVKNMSKEEVFYLIYKLCDEVEETASIKIKETAFDEDNVESNGNGFGVGYDSGYEDGYDDGHSDGYCDGYEDGYLDCVKHREPRITMPSND